MDATRRPNLNFTAHLAAAWAKDWRRRILALCLILAGVFVIVDDGRPVGAQAEPVEGVAADVNKSTSAPEILPEVESTPAGDEDLPVIKPRASAVLDRTACERQRPVLHGHSSTDSRSFEIAPLRLKTIASSEVVEAPSPRRPSEASESSKADGTDDRLQSRRTIVTVSDPGPDSEQPTTSVPPAPVLVPGASEQPAESASVLIQESGAREFSVQTNQAGSRPRYVHRHAGTGIYPGVSRYRANNEADAHLWMSPYQHRASHAGQSRVDASVSALPPLDSSFTAWWDPVVRSSAGLAAHARPVELHGLVRNAMIYSPQVLAIKAEPHVQYHVVGQEEARFDWTSFLDTTFDDLKDPVGNQLALGNVPGDRLKDRNLSIGAGLRRRNRHGGEFEMSQRIGRQRQNSQFFTPNPQGNSRLELQYRQPVMNGAGAVVRRRKSDRSRSNCGKSLRR